jgi:release factor glutamine methyltransferase
MTVFEARARGAMMLASVQSDTASLDASLLLADTLCTDKAGLIIRAGEHIAETEAARFEKLIDRRLSGESVACILGRKEFYGLEFTVTSDVLVPRPDTETLVEAALDWLAFLSPPPPVLPLRVLDLCTGSGAVAISLKHERPDLEVWASDLSAEALAVAEINAARLLPAESGFLRKGEGPLPEAGRRDPPVRFARGDLFAAFESPPAFSLITGNPPYVPSGEIEGLAPEVKKEPRLALDGGEDGLAIIRKIIAQAPRRLCPGGCLLLEADPRQMPALAALLEAGGFGDIQTRKDLSGRRRVIGGLRY